MKPSTRKRVDRWSKSSTPIRRPNVSPPTRPDRRPFGRVDPLSLDAVGPATLPQASEMLRRGGRLISILTVTADGDIEHDRKEAEPQGFRKILSEYRCQTDSQPTVIKSSLYAILLI